MLGTRTWAIRVGGVIAYVVLAGCSEKPQDIALATMEVRVQPLVDSVYATGRIRTMKSVDVSSQLSGRIDEVYVDFNDEVSEGQPLAKLDQQRFQSRVEELRAALSVAEAELASVNAALEGAEAVLEEDRREYERRLDLAENESVSESEVSRSLTAVRKSASALKTLQASREIKLANIGAASASLRQAEIDLERTVLKAPITGIVIKRSIEPGQTVAASLSAPELFILANDLSEIEVHARVDEADIGKVGVGQPVSFTVDAFPARRFSGTVKQIRKAPEIAQSVVSYSVVIAAENPGQIMLPGMTALVEIVTARKDDVLQVPNAALRFEMPIELIPESVEPADASRASVWVVNDDGSFARQELDVGYSDGAFSEITSDGLKAGTTVVVGYQR